MAAVLAGSGLAQAQELRTKAPHQHGPASIRHLHEDGTAESYNWSGYAVAASTQPKTPSTPSGVTVTYVAGSWVVPTATCTKALGDSTSYASFWIGIDGWYSNTVEQIGTDSDCSSGTPQYYAWYEFYPENSYYTCSAASGRNHTAPPCPLKSLTPGDVMSATVTYNTAQKNFTATITDVTQQNACVAAKESSTTCAEYSFSTTYIPNRQTGTPQLSSAEWIAEAPCCTNRGGFLPLADFSTVSFSNGYATVNDTTTPGSAGSQPIGWFPPISTTSPTELWECTMVNQSLPITNPPTPPPPTDIMAQPSTVTNLDDFSVQWDSVGP